MVAICISVLSLTATILTFYLTYLRSANISVLIGPEVRIYHHEFDDFSTGIYVPMTFVNSANNMGTVYKCGITIYRDDSPQEKFFMLWNDFAKLNNEGNWTLASGAHSLAVVGKTSITRIARFSWFPPSRPKLVFKEGNYTLVVHLWKGQEKNPKNFNYGLFINKIEGDKFINYIDNKRPTTVKLLLNKELDQNKVFTAHEWSTLFNK